MKSRAVRRTAFQVVCSPKCSRAPAPVDFGVLHRFERAPSWRHSTRAALRAASAGSR